MVVKIDPNMRKNEVKHSSFQQITNSSMHRLRNAKMSIMNSLLSNWKTKNCVKTTTRTEPQLKSLHCFQRMNEHIRNKIELQFQSNATKLWKYVVRVDAFVMSRYPDTQPIKYMTGMKELHENERTRPLMRSKSPTNNLQSCEQTSATSSSCNYTAYAYTQITYHLPPWYLRAKNSCLIQPQKLHICKAIDLLSTTIKYS